MQRLIGVAAAVVLAGPLLAATAQTQTVDEQIAQAVQVLPEDLRAGATVVTYDHATGARKVLRQGTNFIECQPRSPDDGFTRCYNKALAPRRDLEAKLKAEKKSDKEIQDAVAAAIKAGTIKPPAQGMMSLADAARYAGGAHHDSDQQVMRRGAACGCYIVSRRGAGDAPGI